MLLLHFCALVCLLRSLWIWRATAALWLIPCVARCSLAVVLQASDNALEWHDTAERINARGPALAAKVAAIAAAMKALSLVGYAAAAADRDAPLSSRPWAMVGCRPVPCLQG